MSVAGSDGCRIPGRRRQHTGGGAPDHHPSGEADRTTRDGSAPADDGRWRTVGRHDRRNRARRSSRSRGRAPVSPWAPLAMFVLVHLALLVGLAAATDLRVPWNSDGGAYGSQMLIVQSTDSWGLLGAAVRCSAVRGTPDVRQRFDRGRRRVSVREAPGVDRAAGGGRPGRRPCGGPGGVRRPRCGRAAYAAGRPRAGSAGGTGGGGLRSRRVGHATGCGRSIVWARAAPHGSGRAGCGGVGGVGAAPGVVVGRRDGASRLGGLTLLRSEGLLHCAVAVVFAIVVCVDRPASRAEVGFGGQGRRRSGPSWGDGHRKVFEAAADPPTAGGTPPRSARGDAGHRGCPDASRGFEATFLGRPHQRAVPPDQTCSPPRSTAGRRDADLRGRARRRPHGRALSPGVGVYAVRALSYPRQRSCQSSPRGRSVSSRWGMVMVRWDRADAAPSS